MGKRVSSKGRGTTTKKKFQNGSGRFAKENKLTITFDAEDRKSYLTGFHKRKLERQKVAIEEIRIKEKKERLKQREVYREELNGIVKSQRPGPEPKKARDVELKEKDSKEEKFETSQEQLVTVTTVEYGFGDEDDEKDSDNSDNSDADDNEQVEERRRPRLGGNSIMVIKKKAYKAAVSKLPETKKQKQKSRNSGGAQPKRKGPKGRKQRGRVVDRNPKKASKSGASQK